MNRKRKPTPEPGVQQANLLPVMNIMFLLIPGLLLAMETASMAAISVSAPHSVGPRGEPKPTSASEKVEIELRSDSIVVRHAEAVIKTIPTRSPNEASAKGERFDFEALTQTAAALHASSPGTSAVTLRAENDIELAELVGAMDAMRGPECTVPERGEAADKCWFWQPLIQSH